MYPIPRTSRIQYVPENIFHNKNGTLNVNFTYEGEQALLGIPHGEATVNCKRGFGYRKVVRLGEFLLYNVFDRNFKAQNVSLTKMKILLSNLKHYANDNGISDIAFNEANIIKYNLHKFLDLLESIFFESNWNIKVHANTEVNTEVNYVIRSVKLVTDFGTKPIIELKLKNCKSAALLDTGADVSIIDFDFAIKNNINIEPHDGIGIIGVSGNTLDIRGVCNLKMGAKDEKIDNKIYVVKDGNLSIPFLLGCDFLKKNEVEISFKEDTIKINGHPMRWLQKDNCVLTDIKTCELKMDRFVTFKPRTGMNLQFEVNAPKNAKYFQLTSIDRVVHVVGFTFPQYTSQGIYPIIDGKVDIRIDNNTQRKLGLEVGYVIGEITFIKEEATVSRYATRVSQVNCGELIDNKDEKFELVDKIIDNINDVNSKNKIKQILKKNIDTFGKDENDIGMLHGYEHRIDLTDDVPVALRPFRTPHSKIKEIDSEILRLKKAGIIKDSISAYSAPCLIVYKKNGKPRLVVDFRRLNKKITPIQYPLPHLETALQQLGGNRFFSTLDLLSGYHQIKLREEDHHKTAFSTGRGLYEFSRVPFGMMTSGAAMQYAIERVLGELNGRICQTYIDDIIVYGRTEDEHNNNLDTVLKTLKENGFKLNLSKCQFRKQKVECLGHVISSEGITPNPSKVADIQNKKQPRNIKDVRSFLGMASYYRRFVPEFAKIAKPITELTKKDVRWKWTTECTNAYKEIIDKITRAPVLVYPEFDKTFYVTTDASTEGIGAILTQIHHGKHKPIAFYSRALNNAEKKYHVYEMEALAVKAALQKFRFYLLGYKVIVRTDNQPALYLLRSKECQGRTAKYLAAIMEFNPIFEYIKGKENFAADFLSRNVLSFNSVEIDVESISDDMLKEEQDKDYKIYECLNKQMDDFKVINGLVYKVEGNKFRLVIPESYVNSYITYFHNKIGCHEGIVRTISRMKNYVYWVGMEKSITRYINNCHSCKVSKPSHLGRNKVGEFPQVNNIYERIHMDILGPLPRSNKGFKYLLVAIDTFSHWVFIKPLRKKDTDTVTTAFEDELIKKDIIPETLVIDKGREFDSQRFKEMCDEYEIDLHFCSPYHHASNGLVERMNLQIENSLRCLLTERKGSWDRYVEEIEKSLNTALHGSVGYTPYEVVYNRIYPINLTGIVNDIISNKTEIEKMFKNIKNIRNKKSNNMLKRVNKHKKHRKLQIGDQVYIKINEKAGKLKPFYKGPVNIINIHQSGYSYDIEDKNGVVYRTHINNIK